MAMDAASEYDDIMANYVEARSKLNQMRVSRGYYPVVTMIPDQKNYAGGAGKGKGKKGKEQAGAEASISKGERKSCPWSHQVSQARTCRSHGSKLPGSVTEQAQGRERVGERNSHGSGR